MFESIFKNVVFHFNKKHLEDPTIPMWSLKGGGKTFYVNHVTCSMPWSTKETINNAHTKGSIKVGKSLLTIDDENNADLREPTMKDVIRVTSEKTKNYARIIIEGKKDAVETYMIENEIKYTPMKTVFSSCGRFQYSICDIKKKDDLVVMALALYGQYRVLQPNEIYYKAYENPELLNQLDADYYNDEIEDDFNDVE